MILRTFTAIARRVRRDQEGASVIEFALVAPVVFMLLFGTFHLGQAMHTQLSLGQVVSKAMRMAMIDPTISAAQLKTKAFDEVGTVIHAERIEIDVTPSSEGGIDYLTVTARYPVNVVVPFFGNVSYTLQSANRTPLL